MTSPRLGDFTLAQMLLHYALRSTVDPESMSVATRDQNAWLAENLPTSDEEKEELIFSVSHIVEQDTYTTTMRNGRLYVSGFGSDTLMIVGAEEQQRFLALVNIIEIDDHS